MKNRRTITLILLLLPLLTVCAGTLTHKAESPLQLLITPLTDETSDTIDLRIQLTSRIDLPQLTLQLELSDGLSLLSGEQSWQGELRHDTPIDLRVTIRVHNTSPQSLTARAIASVGGQRYGQQRRYTVGSDALIKGIDHAPLSPKQLPGYIEYRVD